MKIAKLSDLHTNLRSRREEARRVLGALPDELAARGVDLITLAGDLFEEPPTPEEEDWTARWLRRLADVAPVVGATGNHDIGCPTVPRLRLPCSETHAPRHPITIVDTPQVVTAAGCAIACLPWPRTANLLAALPDDTGPELRHEAGIAALRNVLLGLRAGLEQHDGPRILVAHAHVRGAKMGAHAPSKVDFNLGCEDLASVGADIVHLGHLHEHQSWAWEVSEGGLLMPPATRRVLWILYPGSPFANTWGEVEKKGYVIAHVLEARDGARPGEFMGWEFVPTSATPLVHLEYDWQGPPNGLLDWQLVPYLTGEVGGAEARLRYTANADQRDAAGRAAAELKAKLLREGAVHVELDPRIQPTVRARVPEIAHQETAADQVALWAAGQGHDEARVARLRGFAAGLEDEAAAASGPVWPTARPMAARLRSFHLRGMGLFRDVALDVDALPGTVIAVTGENGEGKTGLLEFPFPGALYRATPTQGTLGNRARGRNSLVESRIGDLLLRHNIDTQGSDKVLVQRNGVTQQEVEGPKTFLRWAKENLPPQELFYASVFGAQGSSGFLGLERSDRMNVLLRALGLERVQGLAKRASEQWATAREAADTKAGKLAEERGRTVPVADAEGSIATAAAALEEAHTRAEAARAALTGAQQAAAARGALLAAARGHQSRLDELGADRRRHEDQRGRASARRRDLGVAVAEAPSARALAAEVDARRSALLELERAVAAADEHARREQALLAEEAHAGEGLADLQRRRARAASDLAGRDEARLSAEQAPRLREALAAAEQAGRDAGQAAAQAERDSRSETQAAERARQVIREQRERCSRAERRIEALAGVEEAERRLPGLRVRAEETAAAQAAAEAEVERLRGMLLDGKGERIKGLRKGLQIVATESFEGDWTFAHGTAVRTLGEDDAAETEHAAAPAALDRARAVVDAADAAAVQAARALRDAEALAARRPDLDAARLERDGARANIEQAEAAEAQHEANAEDAAACKARHKTLVEDHARTTARLRAELSEAERAERRLPSLAGAEATLAALDEQIAAARAAHEAAVGHVRVLGEPPPRPSDEDVETARGALARAEEAAARLPKIAAAEATIGELDAQIEADGAAIAAIEERVAALGAAPDVPAAPDVAAAEAAVRAAEGTHREATAAHARAEQTLAAARVAAGRIVVLETELAEAEQLAADWALVARALGRDGIQALLIDAAGPELTSLVNDLLRSCFGSRYTVTISTTRAKKDGSGDLKEVCDVLVYDARHPEDGDREGREFSGGQRSILGEAIALALSVLSCRRAEMREPTLIRDETPFLDGENELAYLKMLRRAVEIVGASKLLFISHNPSTWALADARVHVANGKIEDGVATQPRQLPLEEARKAA